MKTCYHCAKTDKKVTVKLVVPQSVFGDWLKTKNSYISKPDQVYWYHPKCHKEINETPIYSVVAK